MMKTAEYPRSTLFAPLCAALLLASASSMVCAQVSAAASSASSAPGRAKPATRQTPQPPSGLGKQVSDKQANAQSAPDIVMPPPRTVVEDAVQMIEDAQLSTEQMERVKRLRIERSRQQALVYNDAPKPITRSLQIDLAPGLAPPALRLSFGQLTSVVFSDMHGTPWMIDDVRLNREAFDDGHGKDSQTQQTPPTNILSIAPTGPSVYGNVSVKLKGLATPVIFILTAGQHEVDSRVDSKIPGHNPDAAETVGFTAMPSIDGALTSFLDDVPPPEAQSLHVSGLADTQAWTYQEHLYLRTDAEAEYPAYVSAARSTSGKAVYRFAARHNSVTLLSNGRAVTVFIED